MSLTSLAQSPSEKRREIAAWLESADASHAPLELVQEAAAVIEGDAIGFAEDHASDKQKHFQQVFETRDDAGRHVDIFAAMGANRSGKTYVGGWMCFAKHLRDRAQPGDVYWCIAPTLERSIPGQQKELWKSLPRTMFGDEMWQEKIGFGGHRKIVLENEHGKFTVEFHSADQDPTTFEQEKVSGIWADESLPETIFNRILARIIDRRGFIIITDIYEQFWYMERLKEADPAAGVYFQVLTMFDNEANLPAGAIDQAAVRMTKDEQKLRIHGELIVLEGIVYKEYLDHIHAIDPFAIPRDWPRFRIIDYGGSSPTACLWAAISPNEQIFFYREHYERGPSVGKHAAAIVQAGGDEKYITTLIDPAAYADQPGLPVQNGVVQTIARQYESIIGPVIAWPRVNEMGEHAMVQKVKYRLENQTLWVFKPMVNTRREYRSWKYQLDKEGKPKANDVFENANNHALDCVKGFVASNPVFSHSPARVVHTRGV